MSSAYLGWVGKGIERLVETNVVGSNLAQQLIAWFAYVNRLRILGYVERQCPALFGDLDGGDKRILRAFLDPLATSNLLSLLGGNRASAETSEFGLEQEGVVKLLVDAWGSEATFDNSFVERDQGVGGSERWFFVNGILTSRELARRNVAALRGLFDRPFTLIHNPTQGLTNDLVESAMQKFTNINTEPVARAFLEIANALVDENVERVVVISHSQGTIIMGDVLDLLYASVDLRFFDRTNMNDEDWRAFMGTSSGTVKSAELRQAACRLEDEGAAVFDKLELYMFANAASRMCYANPDRKTPHIESFANEHDIVARLGSLAQDDFHKEDLIRIDGSLFTCNRYGHFLNAHYLPDFVAGNYRLREEEPARCIDSSVHDRVQGNPCKKHPKRVAGHPESRLFRELARRAALRQEPAEPASIFPDLSNCRLRRTAGG